MRFSRNGRETPPEGARALENGFVVEARAVSWGFAGTPFLKDVDFCLKTGERCLIAGENGSGKTTFLKILLGLLRTETGKVFVFGREVGSPDWLKARSRAAYVNQEAVRSDFPVSAWEAVEIGTIPGIFSGNERKKTVEEAMELTGCRHLAKRSYATLSGGEKQRVSLARCLAQGADLLLLDEPTASLDPDSTKALVELVESLPVSVVMITHDEGLLDREGWRVLHLRNGRFAEGRRV